MRCQECQSVGQQGVKCIIVHCEILAGIKFGDFVQNLCYPFVNLVVKLGTSPLLNCKLTSSMYSKLLIKGAQTNYLIALTLHEASCQHGCHDITPSTQD